MTSSHMQVAILIQKMTIWLEGVTTTLVTLLSFEQSKNYFEAGIYFCIMSVNTRSISRCKYKQILTYVLWTGKPELEIRIPSRLMWTWVTRSLRLAALCILSGSILPLSGTNTMQYNSHTKAPPISVWQALTDCAHANSWVFSSHCCASSWHSTRCEFSCGYFRVFAQLAYFPTRTPEECWEVTS